MQILGLDVCADTLVGDAMHRGISGGQKKRVTTGTKISQQNFESTENIRWCHKRLML